MKPLMFGPAARRLFGVFHPPERSEGDLAVLVCPPFGQEAIRTHRLFRVICERLARRNAAVLRFDFYGSGDSGGDDLDGELEGWHRDICTAHAELQRQAPGRRIVWFASRLGATLAAMAERLGEAAPVRVVLWDPVIDGESYLQSLRRDHVASLERMFLIPKADWRRALANDSDAYTQELMGVALSPTLLQQLRALSPEQLRPPQCETVVVAEPGDDAAIQWSRDAQQSHASLRVSLFPRPFNWSLDPGPGNPQVPGEAVQRLVAEIDA